ncbi:MAG: alpha-glucan family phosphorylase [Deltaproteobacteria bacterium]
MYLYGKITATSELPDSLKKLKEISLNLWWSWNVDCLKLYKMIDPDLWSNTKNNPVKFIHEVSHKKLNEAANNQEFMDRYYQIVNKFDDYMNSSSTWFSDNFPDKKDNTIAYFSAEYGLDEILPVYSGGLGVLSGDHCKTASDLGLPFVAIGLLYRQGYFNQFINVEGWQETSFTEQNMYDIPIRPAIGPDGNEVIISVSLPGRTVFAKVWQVKVGRISIYMLDTNLDINNPDDRQLTARLYGGDQEMRISQEILLGIGGIRTLDALGIKPTVYHMNEGHSSFLGLELIRKLVQGKGLTFKVAKEVVSACTVFTTHTPVPAGNDVFPVNLIDKYFSNYWGSLGISRNEFIDLGLRIGPDAPQVFNMTVLALKLSGKKNGVSELHGAVSRNIYNELWSNIPEEEIPIDHITNGIHTLTWMDSSYKQLFDRYMGPGWENRLDDQNMWNKVYEIPDEEMWQIHIEQKKTLIESARKRLREQKARHGDSPENLRQIDNYLNPNALTICFARRFATYKRANLIFRDFNRLVKILDNPERPVQIIFSGKAHPADRPAHEIIKQIHDYTNAPELKGKVILIENYNMSVARYLIHGGDIWLNNPRRPLEASGTSGQKTGVNGVINFSVLDGWWVEGYNGKNGWSIGENKFYQNYDHQDNADSESLYSTLENNILPLYFDRDERGIPVGWVRTMKESIVSVGKNFSTVRMLHDYTNKYYVPQIERTRRIIESNYEIPKSLADWKSYIDRDWSSVQITPSKNINFFDESKINVGQVIETSATVYLGNINPDDVSVELYYGKVGENNVLENCIIKPMQLAEKIENGKYNYKGKIEIEDGGNYGYTFRVVPYNPNMINKHDTGMIKWVVKI